MSENGKLSLKEQLEHCRAGDLICVDWCDASTGKSSQNGGEIDVPVRSWGVYLGLIGARIKHIVLAQNSFHFSSEVFDLDYTAIPLGWAFEVHCIIAGHVSRDIVEGLIRSFVGDSKRKSSTGGLRRPRMFEHRMRRLSTHGRPD